VNGTVRVRFAPSPTGHLHVGGARTALFNWLFAKQKGGSFVLRIEDTDTARSTRESEEAVLRDLAWLGLTWDEGPDVGGGYGPYRQSERLPVYRELALRLLGEGKAFRCYCTDEELEEKRKEALARGRLPHYDGTCHDLTETERALREASGARPAVRLFGPRRDVSFCDLVRGQVTFSRDMLGDFVIMRSDGRPTYNFAAAVDDALMEISHVIRAEEHLPNTMRQLLVYESLGHDAPEFAHVSLIVDKDRRKLSKRRGATSVAEFREAGYLPGALVNYLALLGWSPSGGRELLSLDELTRDFDLDRVSPSPAAFDEEKLDWVNAHHIREEPVGRVAELARSFAVGTGLPVDDAARFERVVALARDGLKRLSDLPEAVAFLAGGAVSVKGDAAAWADREDARAVVARVLREVSSSAGAITPDAFKKTLKDVGSELGVKGKDLFMPVRVALTGRTHGPALGEVAAILGRDAVVERLQRFAGASAGRPGTEGAAQ
jgi:nondiscriminating glutamyl-tRNA synthetase